MSENPFEKKELDEFTIEDCEYYLKNYPYGEHVSEVNRQLRLLKTHQAKKYNKENTDPKRRNEKNKRKYNQHNRTNSTTETSISSAVVFAIIIVIAIIITLIVGWPDKWGTSESHKFLMVVGFEVVALGKVLDDCF